MKKLAILGGEPVLRAPFPSSNNIGEEEKKLVCEVLDSGILSGFVARAGEHFLGGKMVRILEEKFCRRFGVKHAVTMNSATTALHAAIAALEIGPGDEVLVTPYTMSATASAILMNHAVPVFVDIEDKTFNIDPGKLEEKITPRTRAIMLANIFGHPADLGPILEVARRHGLKVIEDNAQSPGALYRGKEAGTLGDIGIFSLNFHKIIHCGEGGVLVTNDEELALRARLVRNHGEVVYDDLGRSDIIVLGSNYRMTELQAAVGVAQIDKLDRLTAHRQQLAGFLTEQLQEIAHIVPPVVCEECTHVYYVYALRWSGEAETGVHRNQFIEALRAEGMFVYQGYTKPLYMFPIYQNRQVHNRTSYPFAHVDNVDYNRGLCPTTERMYEREAFLIDVCRFPLTLRDMSDVKFVFEKVTGQLGALKF